MQKMKLRVFESLDYDSAKHYIFIRFSIKATRDRKQETKETYDEHILILYAGLTQS